MGLGRVAATIVLFAACYEDDLVHCADGRACAANRVCVDVDLGGCVAHDIVDACDTKPEGATCVTSSFSGACTSGVCLPGPGRYRYVIDSMTVPTSNQQALDFGADVDGDGDVENTLGRVMWTLGLMNLPSQPAMDVAIDHGDATTLVLVAAESFDEGDANLMVLVGGSSTPEPCADATDLICRRHLDGFGVFDVMLADVTLLGGTFAAGSLVTSAGRFAIPIALFGSDAVIVPIIGGRLHITGETEDALMSVRFTGAVARSEVDSKLFPAIQVGATRLVQRDCTDLLSPGCGCATDSQGKSLIGLFDTNPNDCSITLAELRNNSLLISLFTPDVVVDGQVALSVGLQATAVRASFSFP